MFAIFRRVWLLFAGAGALMLWLSTHSIPETVTDADGYWATNLKHLGWDNPPKALASTAVDNVGVIVGIVLLVFSAICFLSWALDKVMSKDDKDNSGTGGLVENCDVTEFDWDNNEVHEDFDTKRFKLFAGGNVGKITVKNSTFGMIGKKPRKPPSA